MLYCLIADGTFDQVCESTADRDREVKDLRKLGFVVKVKQVANWQAADALEDKMRGR